MILEKKYLDGHGHGGITFYSILYLFKNLLSVAIFVTSSSFLSLRTHLPQVTNNIMTDMLMITKAIHPRTLNSLEQFADLIEGNDTAIILNDTNIGDVNNTLLNSIGINIKEDCMTLPNSTVLYCP
jgi:hypothetical protein